jgi:putative ABC transport system permease protein
MFVQALRMTARDWRAGELRFLLVALIVAVAALTSVVIFIWPRSG